MSFNEKLPLHTRIGTYATAVILIIVCLLMLRNCVIAVRSGARTSEGEIAQSYQTGFEEGLKGSRNRAEQRTVNISNPLLLKMYRKGFRDGSDLKRTTMKKEKNEKK